MLLSLYNHYIIQNDSLEEKRARMLHDYDINFKENEESDTREGLPSLHISIRGRKIQNLIGLTCNIYLVDEKYILIVDSTPFHSIHAYDLQGHLLWDVEDAVNHRGKPVKYFTAVNDVFTENGIRYIAVGAFPVVYSVELETGKVVKIREIDNERDL